eukprot:scaffold192_cov114-Cylindrotheca_fusiformis.AAC.1
MTSSCNLLEKPKTLLLTFLLLVSPSTTLSFFAAGFTTTGTLQKPSVLRKANPRQIRFVAAFPQSSPVWCNRNGAGGGDGSEKLNSRFPRWNWRVNPSSLRRKYIGARLSTTAIRAESKDDDDDDDEEMTDYGPKVADIFGNLRIPASLLAGAALGSAFELPLGDKDGLKLGTVKRLYALAMMGTMSSMLLVVLVSTMTMHDIVMCAPRKAKYVKDYIEQYYALEWMLCKTNFMWGNIIFVLASMLRGWIFLQSTVIAEAVLGVMGSLMLVSIAILLEFTKKQTGKDALQQVKRNILLILEKSKTNRLFGFSMAFWTATLVYMVAKAPYVYFQLKSP